MQQFKQIVRLLDQTAFRPAVLRFGEGVLAGAALLTAFDQFLLTFGTSRGVVTAIAACAAAAILLASMFSASGSGGRAKGTCWVLLGLWSVAMPACVATAEGWWREFPVGQLDQSLTETVLALASAAICLGPGLGASAALGLAGGTACYLSGLAACWLIAPILLAEVESLGWFQLAVGLLASGLGTLRWWRPARARAGGEPAIPVRFTVLAAALVTAFASGAGLSFVLHVGGQLVPASLAASLASWSGVLFGVGLGWRWSARNRLRGELSPWPSIIGLAGTTLIPAAFGWLTAASLWATASISGVATLFLLRGLLLSLLTFPAGVALGSGLSWGERGVYAGLGTSAAGAGFVVPLWLAAHPLDVALACSMGYLVAALIAWWTSHTKLSLSPETGHGPSDEGRAQGIVDDHGTGLGGTSSGRIGPAAEALATRASNKRAGRTRTVRSESPEGEDCLSNGVAQAAAGRRRRVTQATVWPAASAAVLVVVGVLFSAEYRPDRSERLLFSAGIFAAYREGTPPSQLPYLDDGRLLHETESVGGRWSIWKHRGAQLVVRRNGIPVSWTSASTLICPDSSVDVVSVVLPLVMHPAAERVLLLGADGISPVVSALSFPVLEVSSVSTSPQSSDVVTSMSRHCGYGGYLSDSRLRSFCLDPVLAVKSSAQERGYDVIVGQCSQAAVLAGTPQFTRAFYAGVYRQLAEDGLFAQRFSYVDLGPAAVREAAATLRSIFPRVAMAEIAPGELLLMASRGDSLAFNAEVVERLKVAHTREILSHLGWDWSVVASLGSLSDDGCARFIGDAQPLEVRRSAAAFALPVEVARWGNKFGATRAALGKHGEVLGNWLDEGKQRDEIRERLDDVKLAREVEHEHPDHYWAYRATLKERLQKRPRSEIIAVKHEGLKYGLHPEDQRRKAYLRALGEAAKQEHPAAADVARLSGFLAPYDPLLSYFGHLEMAALYGRCEQPRPRQRLTHLLHAVYFGAALDRSVRHICAALEILNRHPECIAEPAARWDHQNGLLEMLRLRWEQRIRGEQVDRKYDVGDTERSLDVVQQTLEVMASTFAEAGVAPEDWAGRRAVLDDELVHVLRAHRSRLARRELLIPVPSAEKRPARPTSTGGEGSESAENE